MIIFIIIAILVLPELLKSSREAQHQQQIHARQEEKARELAERQAARVREMDRRQAERDRKTEMKRSQAAAQLEQLASLRDQYLKLASDLEEQISFTWQPDRKSKLLDKQLKLEQKLYSIDTHIAKLWDVAYSH